nr:ribonuclease H-like domain-containing protein [Tanacetum cinerariifolium]
GLANGSEGFFQLGLGSNVTWGVGGKVWYYSGGVRCTVVSPGDEGKKVGNFGYWVVRAVGVSLGKGQVRPRVHDRADMKKAACLKSVRDELLRSMEEKLRESSGNQLFFAAGLGKSLNVVTVWNELKDTYDRIDESIVFNLLQKTNSFKQGGSPVSEYYHKLNSLWREYEILTKFPDCTCSARLEVANYDKMVKLMQFLMEVFHRGIPSSSGIVKTEKAQASAFVPKQFDMNRSRNNNWSNNGNNVNRGANQHMTNSIKDMVNMVDVSDLKLTIGHPNGTLAKINHVGNLKLNNDVMSKDEVFGVFVNFYNMVVTQFNIKIKTIRSDNGTEFCNHKMDDFVKTLGGIPLYFWTGCILTATYLINRLSSFVLNGKIPFFLVYNKEPNLSHLRSFGCLCYAALIKGSDKFSEKSKKCVLIGYAIDKKAYKLFSLENRNVLYSRDVKFYETIFPYKMSFQLEVEQDVSESEVTNLKFFDCVKSDPKPKASISLDDDKEGSSCRDGSVHQSGLSHSLDQPEVDEQIPTSGSGSDLQGSGNDGSITATPIDENTSSEGNVGFNDQVPVFQNVFQNQTEEVNPRKSSRTTKLPAKFNKYVLDNKVKYGLNRYANHTHLDSRSRSFISNLNKTLEPSLFEEASKDPNWISAMNDEMNALYENDTWYLVDLLFGRKPIGSKWVYKIKHKFDGEDIYQMDINNAFLYGDLIEEVYMLPPPGFFDPSDKRVCKLKKSLYGLKQAPRQWNQKLRETLKENGFEQSKNDHSFFFKKNEKFSLFLLVYVDDIIVTGTSKVEIAKFKRFLCNRFKFTDLGELKYFLGIEVLKVSGGLCLSQRKYCLELLHDFGLLAYRPVLTPLLENIILAHKETEKDKFLVNITSYQRLVGKLIYLTLTRPDISYVVHCLSQHMHAPLKSHFDITLRLLKYLKLAPGFGVQFVKKQSGFHIKAFFDSN